MKRKSWDCDHCVKNKANQARNCGGQFPHSGVAKQGYEISDVIIYECPKTFIKQSSIDFIRFVETSEDLGAPLFKEIAGLPSKLVIAWKEVATQKAIAKAERARILDLQRNR